MFTDTINTVFLSYWNNEKKQYLVKWGTPATEFYRFAGSNLIWLNTTIKPKYPTLVKSATLCGNFQYNGGLYINGTLVVYEYDQYGETKCGSKNIQNSNSVSLSNSESLVYDCYVYIYY